MSGRTRDNAGAATNYLAAGGIRPTPAGRGRPGSASPAIMPEEVAAMWRPLGESDGVEKEEGDAMSERTSKNNESATVVAAARGLAPAGRLFVRLALLACVAALATALSAGAALAQPVDGGGGGSFDPNTLSSNLIGYVGGFVLLIGCVVLATCLYNRQTTAGVVTFLVCGVFAAVCQAPEVMTSVGTWVFEQAGLSGGN